MKNILIRNLIVSITFILLGMFMYSAGGVIPLVLSMCPMALFTKNANGNMLLANRLRLKIFITIVFLFLSVFFVGF